jgi:DNA-binding transcriptional LysR family regulator
MQTLDLAILRTLLAVVETGSFAAAARKIGRSESAVSLQLKRLEEQIGEPIFLRAGKQMTLTGAGARLLEYARRLLELNDEALTTLSETSIDGTVTLGVPHDVTETWLPAVIEGFRRSRASATLKVIEGRSAVLLSRLADDQIDLAIVFSAARPENAVWSADLPMVWIGRDDFGLRKNEPLQFESARRWAERRGWARICPALKRYPSIVFCEDDGFREELNPPCVLLHSPKKRKGPKPLSQ